MSVALLLIFLLILLAGGFAYYWFFIRGSCSVDSDCSSGSYCLSSVCTVRPLYILETTKFNSGNYITSPGIKYFAIMQADGNFVVYNGSGPSNNSGTVKWDMGSHNNGNISPGSYAYLQDDGNFVVMKSDGSAAIWRASSNGGTVPRKVGLTDTGILQVIDSTGAIIWQTN